MTTSRWGHRKRGGKVLLSDALQLARVTSLERPCGGRGEAVVPHRSAGRPAALTFTERSRGGADLHQCAATRSRHGTPSQLFTCSSFRLRCVVGSRHVFACGP